MNEQSAQTNGRAPRVGSPEWRALVEVLKSGTAVLFAGAGCSIPAGLPTWSELLGELETLCAHCGGGFSPDPTMRADDPLLYADRIKEHIRTSAGDLRRYFSLLHRRFGHEPELQPFHRDLARLPIRGVITTNYDRVLESSLSLSPDKVVVLGDEPPQRVHRFLRGLGEKHPTPAVLHVHGYWKHPEAIVLSGDDYRRRYEAKSATGLLAGEVLGHAAASWPFVFVGFSFRDPHFEAFLSASATAFQIWGQKAHFALVPSTTDWTDPATDRDSLRTQRFKEDYGVQLIYYDNPDGSHLQLYERVADLRRAVVGDPSSALIDINRRMREDWGE